MERSEINCANRRLEEMECFGKIEKKYEFCSKNLGLHRAMIIVYA
jgi:hypothetical protein